MSSFFCLFSFSFVCLRMSIRNIVSSKAFSFFTSGHGASTKTWKLVMSLFSFYWTISEIYDLTFFFLTLTSHWTLASWYLPLFHAVGGCCCRESNRCPPGPPEEGGSFKRERRESGDLHEKPSCPASGEPCHGGRILRPPRALWRTL